MFHYIAACSSYFAYSLLIFKLTCRLEMYFQDSKSVTAWHVGTANLLNTIALFQQHMQLHLLSLCFLPCLLSPWAFYGCFKCFLFVILWCLVNWFPLSSHYHPVVFIVFLCAACFCCSNLYSLVLPGFACNIWIMLQFTPASNYELSCHLLYQWRWETAAIRCWGDRRLHL